MTRILFLVFILTIVSVLAELPQIQQIKSDHSPIKEALTRRGWVDGVKNSANSQFNALKAYKASFDFKWTWDWSRARAFNDDQIVNHFPSTHEITTKDGLHKHLKRISAEGVDVYRFYPRSYLGCEEDDFEADFDLIAAKQNSSLLGVPLDAAGGGAEPVFTVDRGQSIDGTKNLWIAKPSQQARGVGIQVFDKKEDIFRYIDSKGGCDQSLIQKYIETPLLIMDRKFDIRQFALVTSLSPLKVYIYDEFYLRFSTVPYNESDVHNKFVHLTNHQIQKESDSYASSGIEGNQWSREQFLHWIKENGYSDKWVHTQRSMEQLIVTAVKAWPAVGHRRNSFELLGFDIMLDKSLHPWLLEINANPGLHLLTDTVRSHHLSAIEDLMRVVVDKEEGTQVGGWKLAFHGSQWISHNFS